MIGITRDSLRWGFDHCERTVFVICETKTGAFDAEAVNKAFSGERLFYALRRFGALTEDQCREIWGRLVDSDVVPDDDGHVFAKVLGKRADRVEGGWHDMTPHCTLELADAVQFIHNRMVRYRRKKNAARLFFPGDLIQFFAWSAGVKMAC